MTFMIFPEIIGQSEKETSTKNAEAKPMSLVNMYKQNINQNKLTYTILPPPC